MILEEIVVERKIQLEREMKKKSVERVIEEAKKSNREPFAFQKSLALCTKLFIIGEIKKASPSKGIIVENFNPFHLVEQYEKADVQALSVLTEETFFKGAASYLQEARGQTRKPILRKDFIFDPYQVQEAKGMGADCILLIVAMLKEQELIALLKLAEDLKMDALVEVHDEKEVSIAVRCGAKIIGVNNRNLKDFTVDLKNTERVKKYIPKDCFVVSESGIYTQEDIDFLEKIGVNGVLIGESLMRAKNIEEKIKELRGEWLGKD